ncbi:uncharacterized protein BT62DRAFT_1081059 [Guyanagaster necrorhizus]|uniref:Uncharacterized protein n=1 Tax=Guyanagaster necrorhizus TaxID=856835 RepID=A0A9P8AM01_9AGAR|nr:uncharacterized protein BT62DRAFT_1081059 [Guyanagaster necrorhizus MCA 3950]KAG7440209.1 hypothetical protein BT62DRAFT_1081059 [Guyanagaster necrorhizus MCA 3950]
MTTATQNPVTDYIPPEIIDAIIDCLWDDKDTLLACSFVCRLFCPRTRVHLFHTLGLKFNGALNIDPGDPSFKRVVEYIKEVKLQSVAHDVQDLPVSSITSFLSSLPNLASLSLMLIFFQDPSHLHSLISHLPGLTDLDLKNVFFSCHSISEDLSSESFEFPTIKRISLYGTFFNESIVESLFHRGDLRSIYVDSLRELHIYYPSAEYLPSICTFIRAAPSSWKSFDIRFRYGAYTPGSWSRWPAHPTLPLTMSTLHVEMKCDLYCDWHIRVMRWLVHSISGATDPVRLETLTLTIIPPYNHDGEHANWEDEDWAAQWSSLDQALAHSEMSSFRLLKVAFRLRPTDFSPWRGPYSREWVKGKLPLLEENDMLEVNIIENHIL